MRCFIGLPLPEPLADTLSDIAGDLEVGRIPDDDALHVTLAFLDEQSDQTLADLHAALQQIRHGPVALELTGTATFGERIVYAAIAPQADLVHLRDKVRNAARAAGIDLQHERFVPHVTLSRLPRHLRGDDALRLSQFLTRHAGTALPPVEVDHFFLWASHRTPHGSRYEELARYPLDAALPAA